MLRSLVGSEMCIRDRSITDLVNFAGWSMHKFNRFTVNGCDCITLRNKLSSSVALPFSSGHNETVLSKGSPLALMYNPAFLASWLNLSIMSVVFSCRNPWLLFPNTSVMKNLFGIWHKQTLAGSKSNPHSRSPCSCCSFPACLLAVSYTHLTLPTIYSV